MGFGSLTDPGVSKSPTSTAGNTIRSFNPAAIPLSVQGATGQTADLFGVVDENGVYIHGTGSDGGQYAVGPQTDLWNPSADTHPRVRLNHTVPRVELGPGTSAPDTLVSRQAPQGTAGHGTLAQLGPGLQTLRYSRLGFYNVKEYGARGDGATDDRPAIQAAVDAASSAGIGVVYFPAGQYGVSCTTSGGFTNGVTLPNNQAIQLLGSGHTTTVSQSSTRILRLNGTNPVVANVDGGTNGPRFRGAIYNIEVHGNNTTGPILKFLRLGDADFRNMRVTGQATSGVTDHGCAFRGAWNIRFDNCIFNNMGSGTTFSAVLFSEATGDTNGNTNTVFMSNCVWENNTGQDLFFSGNTVPSNAIFISNFKMERGKDTTAGSTWPFVHFGFCRQVRMSCGSIGVGGASPATLVLQDHGSAGRNGFVGTIFEHQGLVGGTYYIANITQGTMAFAGCHFDNYASQLTTAINIGASVPAGGIIGGGNTYFDTTTAKKYLDARAGGTGPSQGL